MSDYKKASKMKLRINTNKGILSVEQLWDLSLTDLSTTIKQVKKSLSENSTDDELSFLTEATSVNPELQLSFDILKDIYITKKSERDNVQKAAEDKAHNEKIMSRIYARQEAEFDELSVDELKALLK